MNPPFNTQAVGIAGLTAGTAGVIGLGTEFASPPYLVKLWMVLGLHQSDPLTIAQFIAPLFAIAFGIIASYYGRPYTVADVKPKAPP